MKNATRIFVSTFGAIWALAGIEHGIGEVLQGNAAPSGVMFPSWPDATFFRSLDGEPAMTIFPNLFITGILTLLFSLALLVWAIWFVQRKHGGLVMIILSIAMLLVGGGIFPPILSILVGIVAIRMHVPASPGVIDGMASGVSWQIYGPGLMWPASLPGCPCFPAWLLSDTFLAWTTQRSSWCFCYLALSRLS